MDNHPRGTPLLIEKTTELLLEYIVKNKLAPGARLLNEQMLGAELGVGRSTLREAVRSLVSRNILEVRHGAGTFVAEHTGVGDDPFGFAFVENKNKLVWDLLEIRLMLEPNIAASAAQRATDEQAARIAGLCDQMDANMRDGEPYEKLDVEFHRMMAEASGNAVMTNLIPVISAGVLLFMDRTEVSLKSETKETHRKISDAILRHDVLGARDSMYLHLVYNRDRLRALGCEE